MPRRSRQRPMLLAVLAIALAVALLGPSAASADQSKGSDSPTLLSKSRPKGSTIFGYVRGGGAYLDDIAVHAYSVRTGDLVASDITYGGRPHGHGHFALHVPRRGAYELVFEPLSDQPFQTRTGDVVRVRHVIRAGTFDLDRISYPPAPATPVNTSHPTVTGTAKVGETLSAATGAWDTEGLSYDLQWMRSGTPVAGAKGATYVLTPADAGRSIGVRVIATRDGMLAATAHSAGVTVAPGDAPAATALPAISGKPGVGEQLQVSTGTWSAGPLTFGYRWLSDGRPIAGATAATYTVTPADAGRTLSAEVTAVRDGYAPGTATAAGVTVERAATTTDATLVNATVKAGQRGQLRVVVTRADGEPASGSFEVWVDGKRRMSGVLGSGPVVLPALGVGVHTVRVRYLGDATAAPSSSKAVELTVKRKRR